MSDDLLQSALSWIANYSSFYSVLTVLICFIFMVIFILRLNGDLLLPSTATHHRAVEEQSMIGLQNPFSVHLLKAQMSSLKGGVYLDVSVLDTTLVAAAWGVNIQALQEELQLPVAEIYERFTDKKMFGGRYMEYKDCGQMDADFANNELYIECSPSVTEATLGQPPRTVYPIVIVTVRQDPNISLDYTAIVLQFTVLHLKDSICTLDSHIVYQFLKTNHNQILSLQPIFISTTTESDTTARESSPVSSERHKTSKNKSGLGSSSKKQCTYVETSHNEGHQSGSGDVLENKSIISQEEKENFVGNHTSESNKCSGRKSDSENTEACKADSDTGASWNGKLSSSGNLEDSRHCDDLKEETNLCVVCQNSPVFYTLLLCRHACVCYSCIKLLDRCPMCRGFIDAYFRLGDVQDPIMEENSVDGDLGARIPWWEALNNRLNHMLGFE